MKIKAKVYHEPWGPEGWRGHSWLFDVFDEDAPLRLDGGRRLLDWGYADSQVDAFRQAFSLVSIMREIPA